MKRSMFGALVASAVVGLVGGTAAIAQSDAQAKACYRTKCGKSVKGHEGKCGGTKVEGIADEATCKAAGGAWTTAADAKKYENEME
jgi:hypothetical protein